MNDNQFKPFVPPDKQMREFTLRALILGLLMSVILGAANAYRGPVMAHVLKESIRRSNGRHRFLVGDDRFEVRTAGRQFLFQPCHANVDLPPVFVSPRVLCRRRIAGRRRRSAERAPPLQQPVPPAFFEPV